MLINVPVEELTQKREQLVAEVARIDGLLEFVKNYTAQAPPLVPHPTTPTVMVQQGLPMQVPQQPIRDLPPKTRHPVAGKRRAITTALWTGPAANNELARVLGWSVPDVDLVVSSMLLAKICFLNEHGKLQLGPEGKKQAAWFAAFPQYITYQPQRTPGWTWPNGNK